MSGEQAGFGETLQGWAPKSPQTVDATCGHSNCTDAGSYLVSGRCRNCGLNARIRVTRGHEKPLTGVRCPRCDCRTTMRPGDFIRLDTRLETDG